MRQAAAACASSEANTAMETSKERTEGIHVIHDIHRQLLWCIALYLSSATYVYPATSPSGDDQPHPSFPCLNLKGMTKEQKQHLHQRLYAESMDMMDKFQVLLSATIRSLKEREVSVKELCCHLGGLGAAPPAYRDVNLPVFRRRFPELVDSKKIEEAMFVIGDYCSFFNYRMIEHIINNLGTEQDRKNLSRYKEEFNHYAKRLVVECPAEVATKSDNLATIYVTVDKTYDSYTLESLDIFVNNLRKVFNISSSAVFKLYHIARGSLKLTFQLPYSVLGEIFPLSKEQAVALRGLGVRRLWLVPFDSETLGVEEETAEGK